jgi:putative restriction endonuclease
MDLLERTRIEKSAIDAGFDLTPETKGEWLCFRSTAFPLYIGVRTDSFNDYDVGLSDNHWAGKLANEMQMLVTDAGEGWAARLNHVPSYEALHSLLVRAAGLAPAYSGTALAEFVAAKSVPPSATEVERLVAQRIGQDVFRKALIGYWQGKCAVTGLSEIPLLRASHIKPWSKCDSDAERLDVFNGLLLAPNLDALFDAGWVTFLDTGEIQFAPELSIQDRSTLGLTGNESIKGLSVQHKSYLHWHRTNHFKKPFES